MVAWAAVVISVVSVCIAFAAAWINKEKLRLDLYDRRFRIYESAFTLHRLVLYPPSSTLTDHYRVPRQLRIALYNFQTKAAEGHFLFSHESGVPDLLQQFCDDAFQIVNDSRMPRSGLSWEQAIARFEASLDTLREKMAPFMNFHGHSALPRLLDGDAGDWP